MIPGPVSKVLDIIAQIRGGVDDRAKNLADLNGVLELLYRDEAMMWLYFKEEGCRPVGLFHEPCRNCAGPPRSFMGVVMPPAVKNVTELRRDGEHIQITQERVDAECLGYGAHRWPYAEQLPPRLLQRDPCGSRMVFFQSCESADNGKLVGVEYIDLNGNQQREDIELGNAPAGTSLSVGQFIAITFPERAGWLTVTSAEGQELGRYHPSILIPVHEWFRLNYGCVGEVISYRGLKEPTGLVYETDMVPFSDKPLWRLALKAYEFLDVMEMTAGQSNGLARIFSQLRSVGQADSNAKNHSFNTLLLPLTASSALGTGRRFSQGRLNRYSYLNQWSPRR